ncbi:MAG: sigma-70 family RNA polymerase sigma factor [Acidimicrobiia bacterium]
MTPTTTNGSNASDAALVARIIDGDRDALETVFNRYGGAIESMALRVLRNETLAEDVVQEVFVSFWNAPGKFDPNRGSLRTFLITLGHRRAVDTVRSEEARFKREEKVPRDVAPSIDDEVWALALSDSVRSALEDLNEGEREAITLAYFGGLSYVEVASRLGAPEGTVKSRIRSGMRKLSVSLAGVAS